MFKASLKRNICAILTGAFLLASFSVVTPNNSFVYADELTDAQEKKDDAAEKKKAAQDKLNKLETEKEDIMELIEELDNEISGYEETISELRSKRNMLEAQSAISEDSLQMAYIAEAIQYDNMKERIQFAYENGDSDYISALISVKEYSSVINQSEYVSQVSTYDQRQLNDLLVIEQSIAEYQTYINENLSEIESLKTEAEGEQEALEVMQSGKQATLEEYNIQIADTEYTIEELAAIEAEQDAAIASIEAAAASRRAAAEAAAEEAAKKAEAEKASQQTSTASATDATQQTITTTTTTTTTMNSYGGGAFTWPCPSSSYITSSFGARTSPTEGATSNHMGIDIGCSNGASIVAAADGVVSYVGYLGGAGNAVLIDHGNGLTSCYFHLSGYAVSVGTNVTAGTTIAYAGSTGISTGPHLHFAVRLYGSYVDPMGYL